jgi:hypothetical protein
VTRALRTIRTIPFTFAMLVALLGTSLALLQVSSPDAMLRWASTNVQNLTHRPIVSLLASAVVLDDDRWPLTMLTLALGLGLLERRVGTARALGIFASGQVIATLVTEGAVWWEIHIGHLPRSSATQLDVGVSYGQWALIGAALALLPARRVRWAAAAGLAVVVGLPLVRNFDMTASGHTVAFLVGAAWWRWLPAVRPASASRPDAASRTWPIGRPAPARRLRPARRSATPSKAAAPAS